MNSKPHVFIVDDDEGVRDSLAMLLESAGHPVECFPSAADFLQSEAQRRQGCLVVDVRMPGMDGLTLQEQLAVASPHLPVIIMTGHGDVPLAVRAMKAGAHDFIEKPFTESTILESVASALERVQSRVAEETAAAVARERIQDLTAREREVFEQLVAGNPNKVIAYELSISPRTVEIHRARVMEKMHARSLSHLVRLALMAGIGRGSPG